MPAPKKPPEVKADEFKSAKWNELTRGREFPPSAAPTLAILCQRHKVMRQAVAEMDEFGGGTVYENKAGDIKSLPQIATIKTASAEIRQLNRQLGIADGADELAGMVSCIRRANGQEAIELANGGSVEFSARTRGAARGFTVDTVVFDEAQELTDEQVEAILPTLSAAPSGNRQFICTGTPPGPNSPGAVFGRTRRAALDGEDPSACWQEWSVEGLPKAGAPPGELVELAWETNPAMGYRLDAGFCLKEAASMSLDGFARERLGWWSDAAETARPLIDPAAWRECAVPDGDAMKGGTQAFAVKFSPDGRTAALSVALARRGGPAFVELVEIAGTSRGTDGLADWLLARAGETAALAIDGRAGTAPLVKRLIDRGYPRRGLVECRAADAQASVAMLLDEVNAGTVTHIESPALDDSATKSIRRKIGSMGGFGFGDGPGSIACPVESAALALWAARTARRDPSRRQVVW